MAAVSISETSVNFYNITRRNNPEDRDFNIRPCENLKFLSYVLVVSIVSKFITDFIILEVSLNITEKKVTDPRHKNICLCSIIYSNQFHTFPIEKLALSTKFHTHFVKVFFFWDFSSLYSTSLWVINSQCRIGLLFQHKVTFGFIKP
jgi:hypothetical protein